MKTRLKKLSEQTIVLTGASSGIGLVTARMAAKQGAKLVLASRSEEPLRRLVEEIKASDGEAIYVVADVGNEGQVRRISQAALERFGGFDTWINNAGVSIYGKLEEVAVADMRQLFETNLWGVIYGSLEAVKHLKHRGGALINVGSTVSDRAIPMQGIYSASKHAVKAFTDSLRVELQAEGAPVSVTLVKPGAIDTPYTQNAKNYMKVQPQHPAPVYAPEVVARAILHCAQHPERDVFAGGGGKMLSAQGYHLPRFTDRYMQKMMIRQQRSRRPARSSSGSGLDQPSGRLQERGDYEGHIAESSLYTRASLHPMITGAVVVGAGLTAAALWRGMTTRKRSRDIISTIPTED